MVKIFVTARCLFETVCSNRKTSSVGVFIPDVQCIKHIYPSACSLPQEKKNCDLSGPFVTSQKESCFPEVYTLKEESSRSSGGRTALMSGEFTVRPGTQATDTKNIIRKDLLKIKTLHIKAKNFLVSRDPNRTMRFSFFPITASHTHTHTTHNM